MGNSMKFILKLLSLLILSLSLYASQRHQLHVTFILSSPDLPADSTVFITGGIAQLAEWNPGVVKMDYQGDHSWRKEITLDSAASIEYKYTLGSWEHEGAGADGQPLHNFIADVTHDTTIHDAVYFWTKGGRERVIHGQITGTVRYHRSLKYPGINDRDLIVWLPPGYDTDTRPHYPVLYMHDGQNIIDPVTSSFGTDWSVDETCDSLIRINAIPPLIVVGIYNTTDRMKEYVPGEKGTAYMNFVVEVVKPFIDSVYRTKPGRESTIIGGSSAGGIISFMLAWEHPDVFSKAICMSPAFKIKKIDYVQAVLASAEAKKNVFFYIDNGGVGLETQLQPGVDAMIAALKEKGYQEGKDFVYVSDPTAQHFEAAWAKRFPGTIIRCMMR